MQNCSDQELHLGISAQAYTLANAVRPRKKTIAKKECTNLNNVQSIQRDRISVQVKEELKQKIKSGLPRQPRSHLPMKMIVSKMATRKPVNDENKDPASTINPSTYRQYQLEPPPWRSTLYSSKQRKTSEFEKIILSMKEKCKELDPTMEHSYSMRLQGQSALKQKRLDQILPKHNLHGCDVLTTPRLDFNYEQLYRGRHQETESHRIVNVLDEDPLGFGSSDHQTTEVDYLKNKSGPQIPDTLTDVPQFVWNPVVLPNNSKSELFPNKETENGMELIPSQFLALDRIQELPSCFDSPTWESSPTSSEHTIAEERLQLTFFANRGDVPVFMNRSYNLTEF